MLQKLRISGFGSIGFVHDSLKQAAFNLVAEDSPLRAGEFLAAVEFEVGTGADTFNERPDGVGLSAVPGATAEPPAFDASVTKLQSAADAQQEELLCVVTAYVALGLFAAVLVRRVLAWAT